MIHRMHLIIHHRFPPSRLPECTFLVKIFRNLFPVVYKGVCGTCPNWKLERMHILSCLRDFHIAHLLILMNPQANEECSAEYNATN